MRIAALTFTDSGENIAKKLKKSMEHEVSIFTRGEGKSLKDAFEHIFKSYDGIVFICSTGIAVRFIAPLLKDKTSDPAVVVVDDLGRYSISLLSGHIGGANKLAIEVGAALGAQPIVTTASDGRGIESVDMFALRYNLSIESMEDAKTITAMMVEGKSISFISEINANIMYNNIVDDYPHGYIIVTSKEHIGYEKPCCILRPKNLYIGIGCRRGKSKDEIMEAIRKVFKENNLSLKSIKGAGTAEIKKDEEGIKGACREIGCTLSIFSNSDIEKVQHEFKGSSFVESVAGVKSVAEPCAYLLGGKIIVGKTAYNGVTVAVSREE